ncbi:LytTR family transcriptional regulator [Paenibacillus lycopersici]|uniref:LytTR family transcriptional regulator n=1 Tax=Paenibacillus lycopersici TaxID=2704462 RepID=A0A6C0G548_9BACL|nr:LytTR family transcriptional regulator DNA-binding domain-containing protein [Paenibacillus lycopersici]QHT62100.1 LytTR family transcriptional regulator [Paenibacillus lycopersici]
MRRPFHVVNRRKNDFDIVEIDLDDVFYVGTQNGEKYLRTQENVYFYISRPEEHERFLELQGFVKVDRCFMVQKDKVEFYDEETHKLYFQKEPVGKEAPNAPVSRAHMKEIADIRRSSAFGNSFLSRLAEDKG